MLQSTEPFDVIRVADPAIDGEAPIDWTAFYADRDTKRLSFLPGARPQIFRCRVLSQAEKREVMNLRDRGESTYESRERAFAYCIMSVANYVRADGSVDSWTREPSAGKARALTDAGLAHFGTTTIDEIGGVVEARSFLDRDQPLLCPLLPTSHAAVTAIGFRRAELTRQSADRSALSKQQAAATSTDASTTQPPSPPSSDGAASGAVTATVSPI